MKKNSNLKYFICVVLFLLVYTFRFVMGMNGIPGPYFGYVLDNGNIVWEFGISSTGNIKNDDYASVGKEYRDAVNASAKTANESFDKLDEKWSSK